MRFAYFISAHGFGHAARASAVIAALRRRLPESRFTLFTTTPSWFFTDSIGGDIELHELAPDIGLIQEDPFREDIPATIERFRGRVPFPDDEVEELARRLREARAELVLCDIAPLGIVAARRAGIPSILVENFTWDFIYRAYCDEHPELLPIADYLGEVFESADHRIQTDPVCEPRRDARQVGPISRLPHRRRAEVRSRLGVPGKAALVLVTMGGFEWNHDALAADLADEEDLWVVVPGGGVHRRNGHLVRLPHRSEFYHPDLIHASDAVVGKLGYSTIAEVHRAGLPFAYVTRSRFPESPILEAWVRRRLPSFRLELEELHDGRWLAKARTLLESPPSPPSTPDGAATVARYAAKIAGVD